jgi:hypothetical protein
MEALNTDHFWETFTPHVNKLTEQINLFTKETCNADVIIEIRSNITMLSTFATDAARFLPPYDVKRSQTSLENLKKEVSLAETKFIPKKKFSFKQPPVKVSTDISNTTIAKIETINKPKHEEVPSGTVIVENLGNQVKCVSAIDIRTGEVLFPQILIRHCINTTVAINSLLGAARMQDLTDCTIYLGPCATAVYLERCINCVVFAASHQMRIHQSNNCSLYIKVHSTPIIEDCSVMGFAPYNITYDSLALDLKV